MMKIKDGFRSLLADQETERHPHSLKVLRRSFLPRSSSSQGRLATMRNPQHHQLESPTSTINQNRRVVPQAAIDSTLLDAAWSAAIFDDSSNFIDHRWHIPRRRQSSAPPSDHSLASLLFRIGHPPPLTQDHVRAPRGCT
ncbi:hypothetical protein MLD38_037025 [Melastoma candidum]|uniref:Uncharacterized protein n=1 Tax=Melastoma candidum TaxID=119954 RepID=A0ACB9LNC3_9MYRT|nr:hypothetical protein MLD38_037025 [Melastoma candidum]